jgi:hypothetical protein
MGTKIKNEGRNAMDVSLTKQSTQDQRQRVQQGTKQKQEKAQGQSRD